MEWNDYRCLFTCGPFFQIKEILFHSAFNFMEGKQKTLLCSITKSFHFYFIFNLQYLLQNYLFLCIKNSFMYLKTKREIFSVEVDLLNRADDSKSDLHFQLKHRHQICLKCLKKVVTEIRIRFLKRKKSL